ncbi:MAG: hypothetical protein IKE53_07780 [Clostridiales bacterium]|nr:hypothetical protein [Clostridiales bacterium]
MKITKKIITTLLAMTMIVSASSAVVLAEDTAGTDPVVATESTEETKDLSQYTFQNIYGSQLTAYLDHQYRFNGQDIPLAESNFYFVNAFFELTQYAYYGMYPQTSEGFVDLSAAYSDPSKYATYGDFLISYAERTLESSCIICSKAQEENLTLSEETLAQIDQMIDQLATEAEKSNLTLEQYFQLYYGPSCDQESYRNVLKNYYLADLYASKYCEEHITDDMRYVPNVRYALFQAPEETATAEEKQTAETLANELAAAAGGDLDLLKTLADQSYSDGTCYQSSDITVARGQTVSVFEEWTYDPARQEGDIEVIYAPEFGYFTVGYLGLTEQDQETLDSQVVAQLSQEISESIDNGEYEFGTDQPYAPAAPVSGDTAPSGEVNPDGTQTAPEEGRSSVATVLIIIFAVIGGVAVVAIIIILTTYIVKKINSGKKEKNAEDEAQDAPAGELEETETPVDTTEETNEEEDE